MREIDLSHEIAAFNRRTRQRRPRPDEMNEFQWVSSLAFDQSGRFLAVGAVGMGRVLVYDLRDDARVEEIVLEEVWEGGGKEERFDDESLVGLSLLDIVFTADGRHLLTNVAHPGNGSLCEGTTVYVYERGGGAVDEAERGGGTLPCPGPCVGDDGVLMFAPSIDLDIAHEGDDWFRVTEVATGRVVAACPYHAGENEFVDLDASPAVSAAAFRGASDTLALLTNRGVFLVDLSPPKPDEPAQTDGRIEISFSAPSPRVSPLPGGPRGTLADRVTAMEFGEGGSLYFGIAPADGGHEGGVSVLPMGKDVAVFLPVPGRVRLYKIDVVGRVAYWVRAVAAVGRDDAATLELIRQDLATGGLEIAAFDAYEAPPERSSGADDEDDHGREEEDEDDEDDEDDEEDEDKEEDGARAPRSTDGVPPYAWCNNTRRPFPEALAFGPDGSLVAVVSERGIRLVTPAWAPARGLTRHDDGARGHDGSEADA